jgi:hypothetical protein
MGDVIDPFPVASENRQVEEPRVFQGVGSWSGLLRLESQWLIDSRQKAANYGNWSECVLQVKGLPGYRGRR